jgi:galactose-1-phosphate uridylyltransferase
MSSDSACLLKFEHRSIVARIIDLSGQSVDRPIDIRTHPITGRTCRIAFSRAQEREAATQYLPEPPPDWDDTSNCPFCQPQVTTQTPRIRPDLVPAGRLSYGQSLLFPNLFPYGSHSAVSLFDDRHFVEIGEATLSSYTDCFINCRRYLRRVQDGDPEAIYMALTQNHLPSAGGSLLHPHLQINADRIPPNHHRFLLAKAERFFNDTGTHLFSTYLAHERKNGSRYIGQTGAWEWVAAFAPEGFFEIWGILPQMTSLQNLSAGHFQDLARGVLNIQRYYRSLCRNGYNLGLLVVESPSSRLELRTVMMVRSNYAPWVRNDHTGFEVMLGDMTTFVLPEDIAAAARVFF